MTDLTTEDQDVYAWHDPEPTTTVDPLAEAEAEADAAPEPLNIDFDTVKVLKARKPSPKPRDETGKVLRKGKNLSGNKPFRTKVYALTATPSPDAVKAAPMQVQLILKYMTEHDAQGTGAEIVSGAIAHGYLKTKIDPPVLYAYYARLLEKLGIEHVA
jgi:hypothetical protein